MDEERTGEVATRTRQGGNGEAGLVQEIVGLRNLSIGELRQKYFEVFGEETTNRNREFLFKRIAYRLQERSRGGLTERALRQADALGENAPVRRCLSRSVAKAVPQPDRDPRLPPPGAVLRRTFGRVEHTVVVRDGWFEYRAERYASLSAVARKITGTRWNGLAFFGLLAKERA